MAQRRQSFRRSQSPRSSVEQLLQTSVRKRREHEQIRRVYNDEQPIVDPRLGRFAVLQVRNIGLILYTQSVNTVWI